jgi:4-amino-4-deoxy-L-arabinose transferase-like glycosyltransferase
MGKYRKSVIALFFALRHKMRAATDFCVPEPTGRRAFLFVVGCFSVALFLQIAYFYTRQTLSPDEVAYVTYARTVVSTGELTGSEIRISEVPPFLPSILIWLNWLDFSGAQAAILVISMVSALRVIPLFGMARELFGNRSYGLAAAFLGAVHPVLCNLGGSILRDGPYITFLAFSIWLLILAQRTHRCRYYLGFVAAAILGCLTRREGMEIILIFMIVQTIQIWAAIRRRCGWKREIVIGLLVFIGITGMIKSVEFAGLEVGYEWRITAKLESVFRERIR